MQALIDVFEPIVLATREEIVRMNNMEGDHQYAGLCDYAYNVFKDKIAEHNKTHNTSLEVLHFHGEQSHTAKVDPQHWHMQHTWMGVRLPNSDTIIYIDPTSQQFQWLHDDIPDYYISIVPPKWFYSDRKNPLWNGWTRWLNQRLRLKRKIYVEEDGKKVSRNVSDGIIEFLQYEIWGGLCRLYRRFKGMEVK